MIERTSRAGAVCALLTLTLFSVTLTGAPALGAKPATLGDKYAVKAGKVITLTGDPIPDGVIVIEGGRITAVGTADEVKIPWDAEVLDVPDMVAFPGFVEAHSSNGMDRPNETIDMAPFLNIRDSIDPVGFYFEDSLRWGVTTINVQHGNQCVPCLVKRGGLLFLLADDHRAPLGTHQHLVLGVLEVDHLDAIFVATGSDQRSLVDQRLEVGAGEPGGSTCQDH